MNQQPNAHEGEGRRAPTILVADEDAQTRENVAELLERRGCDVVTCPDGPRLLDALNALFRDEPRVRFDLVICNVHMTGVGGVLLLQGMQGYIGFPPIMLVSTEQDQGAEISALDLGAAAVLRKPLDEPEFVSIVNRLLPPDCVTVAVRAA